MNRSLRPMTLALALVASTWLPAIAPATAAPQQSREQASLADMIASFTIEGAYASFLDDELGSIESGKVADLVVLARDLFAVAPAEIGETEVLMTLFEGRVVFRAEGF